MTGQVGRLTAANEEAAAAALYAAGRTDGLPIVVPTPERVEAMLAWGGGLAAESVLGQVAPGNGLLTAEKAAVNAVMAGCPPEIFPLVVAVCEILCDPLFDVGGIQQTTHCVAPMIIVNGPARGLFNVASGAGAMGPGHRTNLTLGRALRFILINVGGGVPGRGDPATLGSPAKLALCLAEAEEESPWEPLHVSRGFDAEDSVVTLLSVAGPHSMYFSLQHCADQANMFLRTLAAGFCVPTSNNIFMGKGQVAAALNPIHGKLLKKAGLSRHNCQQRLFDFAQVSRTELNKVAGANTRFAPHDSETLRPVPAPEDYLLFISGQEGGGYSAYFPSWGSGLRGNQAVSRKVRMDEACEFVVSQR
jgi:hypothetical protein